MGPFSVLDPAGGSSFEALATSTPPCSPKNQCPSTYPQARLRLYNSPECGQFGVRVVCQGVVQRRTVARARPPPADTSAIMYLKHPSGSLETSSVYASTSSLSTCSNATNSVTKSPFTMSRSTKFSKWRRLWATLVLVGDGYAAYMIYFEPKSKNATQRNEVCLCVFDLNFDLLVIF